MAEVKAANIQRSATRAQLVVAAASMKMYRASLSIDVGRW